MTLACLQNLNAPVRVGESGVFDTVTVSCAGSNRIAPSAVLNVICSHPVLLVVVGEAVSHSRCISCIRSRSVNV